jgi:hypothetical protein
MQQYQCSVIQTITNTEQSIQQLYVTVHLPASNVLSMQRTCRMSHVVVIQGVGPQVGGSLVPAALPVRPVNHCQGSGMLLPVT